MKLIGSGSRFVPYIVIEDRIFFGLIRRRRKMYVIAATFSYFKDISDKSPVFQETKYCLTEIYYWDSCYAESIESASNILETVFLNNGMELLINDALKH